MSEKLQKTIAVVKTAREFETNGKTLHAHDVVFDDGEEGGCITGPSAAESEAMQAALQGLKGTETEFDVDGFREFQGTKKWKIVGFPGKPKGAGGGGRTREWVDQTPSMEAQGAVKNAIAAIGPYTQVFADHNFENDKEYIGLVREFAIEFYRTVQDVKGRVPQQETLGQPETKRPMQDDAVRIFGSEGSVQVAYKRMFGQGTSFDAITDEELEALIDQKNREETDA